MLKSEYGLWGSKPTWTASTAIPAWSSLQGDCIRLAFSVKDSSVILYYSKHFILKSRNIKLNHICNEFDFAEIKDTRFSCLTWAWFMDETWSAIRVGWWEQVCGGRARGREINCQSLRQEKPEHHTIVATPQQQAQWAWARLSVWIEPKTVHFLEGILTGLKKW